MKRPICFLPLFILGLILSFTNIFAQTNLPKHDYFLYYVGGLTMVEIADDAQKEKYELLMLPEDKSFQKYTSNDFWAGLNPTQETINTMKQAGFYKGISREDFHKVYVMANNSFKDFHNTFHLACVDKTGLGYYDSQGRVLPGYDEYGRQIASPQEVAKKRAEYEAEQKNPPKEDYTLLCECRYHSYWSTHKTDCDNEERKFGLQVKTIWETICPQTYSLNINSYGGLNKKDMIIRYDKDGLPFWQVVYVPK